MKKQIYIYFLLACPLISSAQHLLSGRVLDSASQVPLAGASVRLGHGGGQTGPDGIFHIQLPADTGTLVITYTGYRPLFTHFTDLANRDYYLSAIAGNLKELVVSTGYQQLPAERATGSFATVDNTLLNRRVSTDVLSRLEDVTPGLIFNRNVPGRVNDISIRGQATLFSNAQPLIVLDNFPYDGDLNNINPNDVENVTVLKDAAAASIWGSRAGNGVIVITTKKGHYNRPVHLSFNSNVTVGAKPNLFYASKMSTSDFIDVEQLLFSRGFYNNSANSPNHTALTPVVDLLFAAQQGTISNAEATAQINTLRSNDVRRDFDRYYYQPSVDKQYALNLDGGTADQKYNFSVGYDHDRDNLVRNGFRRLTLQAGNTYGFLNHKLELTTGLYLTQSEIAQNNQGIGSVFMNSISGLYPYARLADPAGNPLPIVKDYRTAFVQDATSAGLLNWQYYPLQDLRIADNTSKLLDYRLNANLSYHILRSLTAQVLYLYERGITNAQNDQSADSYYARNLVNSFTQVSADGTLSYPVPKGGILDQVNTTQYTQDFRGQISLDQPIGPKGELNAIAGYEIRSLNTSGNTYRVYGYDDTHAISNPVDYVGQYSQYYFPALTSTVPYQDAASELADHNLSWYANAAYIWDKKYTLSGSARFDQSNLFGVKANQKGVPLWSAGFSWETSQEKFYHLDWLPYLRLRATYGVSGNVNKSISAYTTAYYSNAAYSPIGQPYAMIINPPDPELSWERIRNLNLGIDFRFAGNRLSGSLEYYHKAGLDLIGSTPVAPSTGMETFTGNNASTLGHGIDLALHSDNLKGSLKWQTNFMFSYNTDKVSGYKTEAPVSSYLQFGYGGDVYPLQGKPLYAIYSYKWAGLDPLNGNPRGYLNGQVSEDYAAIIAAATPENIVYNGPARPTAFGALRNTFSWKGFSLSANVSYRLGYYFRKSSVRYSTVLRGQGGSSDYALRWQHPGDETRTHVPSMPSAVDLNRDNLYTYADILVASGDNIRLQDVNLSYDILRSPVSALPFSHASVYLYANNLALLWKANNFGIDPDYQNGPPPKTIAVGLKADFK
jgi:TonB-linked SusC/RagA family outer membrane protein